MYTLWDPRESSVVAGFAKLAAFLSVADILAGKEGSPWQSNS